jgi:hypothetical protein
MPPRDLIVSEWLPGFVKGIRLLRAPGHFDEENRLN